MLHDTVQINEITVDIVDYFNRCWRTQEIQRSTARKNLNVALMFRKTRNETVREPALAADPRNDGICHCDCLIWKYARIRPAHRWVAGPWLIHWLEQWKGDDGNARTDPPSPCLFSRHEARKSNFAENRRSLR
jgi:hypothetical protein